jgi:hypothetical protein
MGGICTKKEPEELKQNEQDGAGQFYVETKLDDLQNVLSTDQDNLDLATQQLKNGQKTLQHNQESFEDMRIAEEEHMINKNIMLETEQLLMKGKSENLQIREENLKQGEDKLEKLKKYNEKQMHEGTKIIETKLMMVKYKKFRSGRTS